MSRRAVLAAVAASLALPASAAAHADVQSMTPRPGSSAARSLASVRVTFDAGVLGARLQVTTAGGRTVSRGDGSLNRRKTAIRVRLRSGLRAGRYRATVRFLADDGHTQSRSWTFRLR